MPDNLSATDVDLINAFNSYLEVEDLEGLVSDLQIYLGKYMDPSQIEEMAQLWVTEIEEVED